MSIKDELARLTGVSGNSIGDVLDSVDSLGGGADAFVIGELWRDGNPFDPVYQYGCEEISKAYADGVRNFVFDIRETGLDDHHQFRYPVMFDCSVVAGGYEFDFVYIMRVQLVNEEKIFLRHLRFRPNINDGAPRVLTYSIPLTKETGE